MTRKFSEVIGFDLGHGETALTRLRLNDMDKRSHPESIEVRNKKNQITAIGYHPTKGILIGEPALITKGVTESHITFKKRPIIEDPGYEKYEKVIKDFIRAVHGDLVEKGKVETSNSLFIVGCPSEWTQTEAIVSAYKNIFVQAGIPNVTVIAESRAALMHAIESDMLDVASLRGSVLIVDIGSSTSDFTLVDLKNKKSVPFDAGRDLGAAQIDKAILQWTLENSPDREILENLFEEHPWVRNTCELACRKAKEKYFSEPEVYDDGCYATASEDIQGRCLFVARLDGTIMNKLLGSPVLRTGDEMKTWPSAFEDELRKLKQQVENEKGATPGVILLTGGASRMHFIHEICKKTFPNASIKSDDNPEFCITKGLARWGRVELNTQQFSKDIEKFCAETIKPRVSAQIDALFRNVAAAVAAEVIQIIKAEFDNWKDRTYYTINNMQSHIDEEIRTLMKEENLSELFKDKVRPILTAIGNDLRDDITALERKYGIPIGTLGTSFDLTTPGIGRISVGSGRNIDAMDGMAESLSNIIGWISGILAAVVTYIVGPFILGIVISIVAIISTTLASIILAILVSNPGGWAILAGVGVAGMLAGGKAKEAVVENMPSWDLPLWVRNLVQESKVYSSIDEQQSVIANEVTSKLKGDSNIKFQLLDKITGVFEKSLTEKAEEARLLIS